MTSPLLALFVRSLRENARLKMTYAARAALVLVVGVFMIFAVIASGWRGAPGLNFFTAIVHIQTVFITLAGLSYFSSAITEEKEENMLGLLRMTELDPLSILLGKSTSRLCGALLLLAAQFPFTLLAVTLGGVTARQIVGAYLALGAYTFFLCNLALLASVVARRTGHAATFVGAAVALPWVTASVSLDLASSAGLGVAGSIFQRMGEGLVAGSISARLQEVLDTGFDGTLLGWQFAFNLGAGLLLFAVAWLVFERASDRDSAQATFGAGAWLRRRLPPGRAWPRALVWKDACFIHGGRGRAAVEFAGYGVALAAFLMVRWSDGTLSSVSDLAGALLLASAFGFLMFVFDLGLAASRIYRLEVKDGTFSSLSLLPMSIVQLHLEKVKSCHHAVLPAAAWTALTLLSALVLGAAVNSERYFLGVVVLIVGFFFALPQLILYFNLVAWLSLKTPRVALPLAIAAMWLGNVIAGFVGMLLFGIGILAIPIVALILAAVSRGKLLDRLEELAAEG